MIKLEDVKKLFKENNCECLEFTKAKNPIKYKCKCGNTATILLSNFKKGSRCMKCTGTPKYTIEYVKKFFKQKDCILLEEKYISNLKPMKFKCKCGNISTKNFSSFKNRTSYCSKCSGREKYKDEFVKEYYKKFNCELLEKYKNKDKSMKYKCNCGEIYYKSFKNFQLYQKCVVCSNKGSGKYTFEYVKGYFKEKNCELLSIEYKNGDIPLKYKCECYNISKISFMSFLSGCRCRKCGEEKKIITNNEKYGVDHVMQVEKFFNKQSNYKRYEYILPSKKIIKLQGYEKHAMDILLNIYNENEISFNIPIFNYIENNRKHKYYPDIYIPVEKLIIEVKSDYTFYSQYEKNLLKKQSVLKEGYNFEFWILKQISNGVFVADIL
jgi:hypothetical protein